jgi:hypothetical protein
MVKPQYPTFEDWYNEIEITAFRSERFLQHLDLLNNTISTRQRDEYLENWLRAAFESARLQDENS